ncbi:hypothetical protein KIL84_002183 [Mauremys mutica]|uniref:Uncharacterized protein n=1 Tax=Mauremys mutica TaxID=74926 RepID=A0A9D3XIJ7_9SAUR|nr:hypothetical protein KIL84_002183 [Mauremys mutica]
MHVPGPCLSFPTGETRGTRLWTCFVWPADSDELGVVTRGMPGDVDAVYGPDGGSFYRPGRTCVEISRRASAWIRWQGWALERKDEPVVNMLGRALRDLELSAQIQPLLSFRAMSSAPEQPHASHSYETLKVSRVREKVFHVELNRPDKRNAMNTVFWREMVACFNKIAQDSECHAVVVSGAGKLFTAGIDLMEMGSVFVMVEGDDTARKAWNLRKKIREYQESFTVLERCPKPVIAAVHGGCIGGGVDLISACDIRYCTQDAWFQVKEVDIGLAADVGTLQRLPRIIGNQSLVNELAFTARKMMAPEAESSGLVR